MKAIMMLADFAQTMSGKLYIMGGGWSLIHANTGPFAIALRIEVPWNETNRKHTFKLELVDEDYRPVLVPGAEGNVPLTISGDFEVGRPPGVIQGSSLDIPFAFNIGPVSLLPSKRYVWKLSIDGKNNDSCMATFSTKPAEPSN